jgi:hypothetical protein
MGTKLDPTGLVSYNAPISTPDGAMEALMCRMEKMNI